MRAVRACRAGLLSVLKKWQECFDVKGCVENLKDGSVKIVCETDENILRKFVQSLRIRTDLLEVKDVGVTKTEPAADEFGFFEIKYGPVEEEVGERMVAAINIAAATRQDIRGMHTDLKSSIGSMHTDMNRHFEEMANNDVVSSELLKTREELKSAVDTLVELVHEFVQKP